MNYSILIAEDDPDIIKLLRLYLESEGHLVIAAEDGESALDLLSSNKIDLAIIDIMMPNMDGYELLKNIRLLSNLPVIILSAKSEVSDKILGLKIGADDYLSKPFNPLEVIARVNSNLRRFYELNNNELSRQSDNLTIGPFTLNMSTCKLFKNDTEINITPTEYKILLYLMQYPSQVFTKMQIYQNIKGPFIESDDNTIMVHISNLRDKMGEDKRNPKYLKTVKGLGYKIENI